jgi:hypothetical protein
MPPTRQVLKGPFSRRKKVPTVRRDGLRRASPTRTAFMAEASAPTTPRGQGAQKSTLWALRAMASSCCACQLGAAQDEPMPLESVAP